MPWLARFSLVCSTVGVGLGACSHGSGAPPADATPAVEPLPPDEVETVVAGGDPYREREAWVRAVAGEVRFVEYTRSQPIVGRTALDAYLQRSGKARGRLERDPVRRLSLPAGMRVVETLVRDDRGRAVGATLTLARLEGGVVHELRIYGQPERWPAVPLDYAEAPTPETVQGPQDAVAVAVVDALLEAERAGDIELTAEIPPTAGATALRGVLLPPPEEGAWSLVRSEHGEVAGAGAWVVAFSRLEVEHEAHAIPLVVHRGLVAQVQDGEVASLRLYVDPLELGPVPMGFRRLGAARGLAENETGGKVWGPSRPWCCRNPGDSEAAQCWMLDASRAGTCDRPGWNEYVCRHRHGCVGDHCFCCESGVDAACEPEPEPEPPKRRPRPGRSRRPAQPTIWSPY